MKLQTLSKKTFTVTGIVEGRNNLTCPVTDFLWDLPKQYQGSGGGIVELFDIVAEKGLDGISSKLCHYVDKNNKIYEFIKGDLRILFFRGHCNVIVIATHGIIKKTKKTPEKDKKLAIKYKNQYQKAHGEGTVEILKEIEDE